MSSLSPKRSYSAKDIPAHRCPGFYWRCSPACAILCPHLGRGPRFYFCQGFELPATIITLQCTACKERNYTTTKNKKNDPDRMELAKFCRRCRKHTQHRETK